MKRTVLTFGCCLIAALAAVGETVQVDGGLISGTVKDGVRSFKGIPFAAPPVGDLRWKAPQPVVPWEGVRKADAYGPDCPHQPYGANSLYTREPHPQSEDCLYLNVWTAAASADERRPVMVWIHGGGLTRGGGSTPSYDGTALAKKGVVLLTINYRLGPLGFLAHPELSKEDPHGSSGNYGMLDQVAALEWVQRNIAKFGGDPNRVTIFGESAGSFAVNYLMASPLAKGLFHRAIGESGASFRDRTLLNESREGQKSAEEVGLAFAEAAGADSIAALRALSSDKILDIFANDPKGKQFRSRPNIDGWFLEASISDVFQQGKQNDVPLIVGSNRDELTAFIPEATIPKTLDAYRKRMEGQYGDKIDAFNALYPVQTEADIKDAVIRSSTDASFGLSMRTWARAAMKTGKSKVYQYHFTRVPPIPNKEFYGAFHASEILYVFNNLRQRAGVYEDVDHKLSDIVSDYWVNFAATGDPNGQGLPEWAPFGLAYEAYIELGDSPETKNYLLPDKYDFFEENPIRRW